MQVSIPSKADIRIRDLDVGSQESNDFIDEYVPKPHPISVCFDVYDAKEKQV